VGFRVIISAYFKDEVILPDPAKLDAACHCGAVKFQIALNDGLNSARRCSCSYCEMRGAVAVSTNLDGIMFVKGRENLRLYQLNTKAAEHYFCSKCGIYTHHKRRSNPNEFGVNASCIQGVSPFDFTEVTVMDGKNHPKDGASGILGILKFIPT
jgi:hypothetical protein